MWRRKTISKLQIFPSLFASSGVSLCFFQLLTVIVLQGYFVQLEFILALLQERNLVKVYGEDDRRASDPRLIFTAQMVTSDTGCPLWMYIQCASTVSILLSHTYG